MAKKKIDYASSMIPDALSTSSNDGAIAPDPALPTLVTVTLDQLVSYDKNPRKTRNPNYDEIKESIRNRGLDHAPNVTRQSPSDPYMVKDGGNTRIQILKELYEEAKSDPEQDERRFYVIDCMFHPYTNDIDMLAGHMIENEMRGHTLFIERAVAAAQFRSYLESEAGSTISINKLSKMISSRGWTVNQSNLNQMLFANDVLLPIIPNVFWEGAGRPLVKSVRKLISDGNKLWDALAKEEDPSYAEVWQAAFSELDKKEMFDYEEALLGLERAIARCFSCQLPHIQAELQAIMQGATPPTERPVSALDTNQKPIQPVSDMTKKRTVPSASLPEIPEQNPPLAPVNAPDSIEPSSSPAPTIPPEYSVGPIGGRAHPTPERVPTDTGLAPGVEDYMTAAAMTQPYPNDTLRPNGTTYVYPNGALSERYVRLNDDGEAMPIPAMLNLPFEHFMCEWDFYGGGAETRVRIMKHRLCQDATFMARLWAIDDAIVTGHDEEFYNDIEAPAFTFNEHAVKRVLEKLKACKDAFYLERNFQDPEIHLRWRQLGILCYLADVITYCMEDFSWSNNTTHFTAFINFSSIDANTMRMARAKINEIRALGASPHSEDIFKDTAFNMACVDACMGAIMHWRIVKLKQGEYLSHGFPID